MPELPPEDTLVLRSETVYSSRFKLVANEFKDPGSLTQESWREMLRTRMFLKYPGFFLFRSFGSDQTMLGPKKLREARKLSKKARAEFLDDYSFRAYESREVIVGQFYNLK